MAFHLARLALVALVTGTVLSVHGKARKRLATRPRAQAKPLQAWEAEGGALPVTGSQTGPDPSTVDPGILARP